MVCGLSGIGVRTVEQLDAIGVRSAVIDANADAARIASLQRTGAAHLAHEVHDPGALAAAGLQGALAVICADDSDLRTLETALMVRDLRPDVPVVVHLDNPAVGRAVAEVTGDGSVLDVAALFAPSVVDGCLGRSSHDLELGSEMFVVAESPVPRPGTLRELFGDLAPIGVERAGHYDDLLVCPGRDLDVKPGDRVTVFGTAEQVEQAGLGEDRRPTVESRLTHWRGRLARGVQGIGAATDRAVRATLLIGLAVLIVSTLILHGWYRTDGGGHMHLLQAAYFTVETAATVGFGDFSFASQNSAMQAFGIALIVAGTTLVSTLFALVTNALVARRLEQSLGRGRLRGIGGHVVMIGLGSVGMRVLEGLTARGRETVVVERDEDNRYIGQARALGVPVVIGDATLGATLADVRLETASAVAIMTSDDLTNLETGLAVRDRLGERWEKVPVILRVFDRGLGSRLENSFDFRHVWSTSAIAAPWFVGAAVGFGVITTFYVANRPFLVARLPIGEGGGLAGVPMRDLAAEMRVVAIRRGGARGRLEHPPRRDTRFAAGDEAYLVGPYEELLRVVARERGEA